MQKIATSYLFYFKIPVMIAGPGRMTSLGAVWITKTETGISLAYGQATS